MQTPYHRHWQEYDRHVGHQIKGGLGSEKGKDAYAMPWNRRVPKALHRGALKERHRYEQDSFNAARHHCGLDPSVKRSRGRKPEVKEKY